MITLLMLVLYAFMEEEVDTNPQAASELKGKDSEYGMDNKLLSEIERLVNDYNVFVSNLAGRPDN